MRVNGISYRTVWLEGGVVKLIDQRLLPHRFEILECPSYRETAQAISAMAVRGAGAIGVTAGYAMAQAALEASDGQFASVIEHAAQTIRKTRPTAHDLFYAVEQVHRAIVASTNPQAAREAAVKRAIALSDENANAGERIGQVGISLLRPGMRVLTHCNAGWLAFSDWGSALAPIYAAHRNGTDLSVYLTETRPRSQGAKLTAWELAQEGVPHTLIADTAAGFLFQRGQIDCVIVGADRIAANGDVANKIGTYPLALLAKHHGVPFYVAAPRSTFDLSTVSGQSIPIEERSDAEVLSVTGLSEHGLVEQVSVAPTGCPARNPAFDITPAAFVTSFITEDSLIEPTAESIKRFVEPRSRAAFSA